MFQVENKTLMDCYRLETLSFSNPTLRTVPVSYLITMHNSKRRRSYMHQLRTFRPTSTVIIVHNKGFRRCSKEGVASPSQDLWHANKFIASLSKGKDPVLILEDDVQFTSHFVEKREAIDSFLYCRRDRRVAYSLGLQGLITLPFGKEHIRFLSAGFAHAVVYTRPALNLFSRIGIPSWGVHDLILYSLLSVYGPRRACAVQRYEVTPNSRRWDVLQITKSLNRICGNDPERLFSLYDGCNRVGGFVPVVIVLSCTVYASLRYQQVRLK